MKKTSKTVFLKNIPLTLFERFVCERELESKPNCNILTSTLRAINVVFLVLQGCSTGGPGDHSLLDAGFLYRILSPTGLQTQSGVPKAPSAGCWLSLPHLVSNSSDLQLSDLLSPPSYIIVQSSTHSLEWHVWSSSSGNNCHAVHRSLISGASVYEYTMGFYLVPYCQPRPPTRVLLITAIGMCHFLPVHHFEIACLAESKVNIQQG